jgi:Probable cobalt transporter subunit (CbtA)
MNICTMPAICSASLVTSGAQIMVGNLLLRGMLAGVLAGLIAFGFARVIGEPQIDLAIAFEEQASKAAHHASGRAEEAEPELVSRETQAGLGLLTGMLVYGAAIGGLFALAFACAYGRLGSLGARETSALIALAGFVAVVLVPFLKYPANPPSVGEAETIGARTGLFAIMLITSLASLAVAVALGRRLWAHHGGWNATLIAGAAAIAIIVMVQLALPAIDEVPEQFSATLLWRFRMASLGIHAILWTSLGLLFGILTEGSLADRRTRPFAVRPATR